MDLVASMGKMIHGSCSYISTLYPSTVMMYNFFGNLAFSLGRSMRMFLVAFLDSPLLIQNHFVSLMAGINLLHSLVIMKISSARKFRRNQKICFSLQACNSVIFEHFKERYYWTLDYVGNCILFIFQINVQLFSRNYINQSFSSLQRAGNAGTISLTSYVN